MPKVMRHYSYDSVFKSGCSGVSREALPVPVISKSLCIDRHAYFLKSEAVSIPSKAELDNPVLLEAKIKIVSEFGKQLLHCFVKLTFFFKFLDAFIFVK